MLMADGFEGAFVGVARRCGQPDLAVYSVRRCRDILVERDGMTHEDAADFLEFNTVGAWMGELTPIWLVEKENDDDRN